MSRIVTDRAETWQKNSWGQWGSIPQARGPSSLTCPAKLEIEVNTAAPTPYFFSRCVLVVFWLRSADFRDFAFRCISIFSMRIAWIFAPCGCILLVGVILRRGKKTGGPDSPIALRNRKFILRERGTRDFSSWVFFIWIFFCLSPRREIRFVRFASFPKH